MKKLILNASALIALTAGLNAHAAGTLTNCNDILLERQRLMQSILWETYYMAGVGTSLINANAFEIRDEVNSLRAQYKIVQANGVALGCN